MAVNLYFVNIFKAFGPHYNTNQMIEQSACHRFPPDRTNKERIPTQQQTKNYMKNLSIILFVSGVHSFRFFFSF